MFVKIKETIIKYEKYFSPVALLAGFTWDNLTLQRIDLWLENLIMISYLALALVCILLINAYESGRINIFKKVNYILPFVLQFTFGGLFSAFVIFYTRSSSILASWPFLLVLASLLVGNELFRKRYERLTFQMSIYFVAVFSYSVFALPVLLGRIGPDVFIISGYASLGLIAFILIILRLVIPIGFKDSKKSLAMSIIGIYAVFNVLYFTNIIPPIPLSLKERGIYHEVARTAEGYSLKYEPSPWYVFWRDHSIEFHWIPGRPVYCFSSVFAPTDISTRILHRWKFFDEKQEKWVERGTLGFPIVGGRDGGYRGYSVKYNLEPGKWQVDIITERGQVLGRSNFVIVQAENYPFLENKIF